MATPTYNVDYDDERFQQVESDKSDALSELEKTYAGMIGESDKYFQDQIDASKQWAEQQQNLQNQQNQHTIDQINQQKDQAHKNYIKEQSGAYVDWRKQSNEYGTEAEKMASAGLDKTGFSESSQVSMYNTYQNRVASAREVFNNAVLNYDNAIKDAQLQNSSVLAEIAYNALQQQLELSLQGFQYKNNLILEQAQRKTELDNQYWGRYLDVLNQINTENAMAEDIRQFELNYQMQTKQFEEQIRQFNQEYAMREKEFAEQIRQFNEEIARLKKKDEQEYQMQIQQLELEKKQVEQQQKQWEAEMALKEKQLAESKRQFDLQYQKSKSSGSSSKSSSSSSSSKSSTSGSKSAAVSGSTSSSKQPAVNMQSVINLGYGPISASRLASLEASGVVTSYVKDGQRYYKNTAKTSKLKELYTGF
jgi:hypothetical protein